MTETPTRTVETESVRLLNKYCRYISNTGGDQTIEGSNLVVKVEVRPNQDEIFAVYADGGFDPADILEPIPEGTIIPEEPRDDNV